VKFLTWLLGVFVLLLALEYSRTAAAGWTPLWVTAMVFWFFAGVGAGLVALVKLASGKVGAGALSRLASGRTATPAPHKEE